MYLFLIIPEFWDESEKVKSETQTKQDDAQVKKETKNKRKRGSATHVYDIYHVCI